MKLKTYQIVLSVFFILWCLLITGSYGWIGYATLTERPGLNGDYYYYYQITRPEFYIYNFIVVIISIIFIIAFVKNLLQKNAQQLKKTFLNFAIFIVILFLIELFFIGKIYG